tara:strand:- start:299 stop:1150 length:852 start_codon:yes stop_codon:yes gene_type:complete
MSYTITKQLGSIQLTQAMLAGEMLASTAEAEYYTTPTNFLGVKKHDDDFMNLGGTDNMSLDKYSFATVEKIDLRPLWSDGMVIDEIQIDLQRCWELPRVLNLWNYDPTADIWETVIITTDNNIESVINANRFHVGGFQDVNDTGGLGFLSEIVYAETRIYGADPSRKYSGNNFASYSTDEANFSTYLNGTLAYEDSLVRGYPKLISAPSLYVYRVVTSFYAARSPTSLEMGCINAQQSRLQCIFSPIAVTVRGQTRKGTETERIREATDTLLQQPARPEPSRP